MKTDTLYHVTPQRNLASIRTEGLQPQLGARSTAASEPLPAVFCFNSRADLDNALSNWLGEAFDDFDGELCIVQLDVPRCFARSAFAASFEVAIATPIPPSAMTAVYTDTWLPLQHVDRPPATVPAQVRTDLHSLVFAFDATSGLSSLDERVLCDLARGGFSQCEAADQLAYAEESSGNAEVIHLLEFCRLTHRTPAPQGFEVSVDADAALAWVLHHRPQWYAACVDARDAGRFALYPAQTKAAA